MYARHNAIGTPALLPDGNPTDRSVPESLRGVSTAAGDHHEDAAQINALAAGQSTIPSATPEDES